MTQSCVGLDIPYSPLGRENEEYKHWKTSRKCIINQINKQILDRTDDELKLIFKEWEGITRDNLNFTNTNACFVGLMHISILFHYQNVYESINELVPLVQQFINDKHESLVKVAAKCLHLLADDSSNIDYFSHIITETYDWLSNKSKHDTFKALVLLHNSYGYSSTEFHDICRSRYDILFNLAIGVDTELQDLALKVLKHHLKWRIPENIDKSYDICIESLRSRRSESVIGSLRVLILFFRYRYLNEPGNSLRALSEQLSYQWKKDSLLVKTSIKYLEELVQMNMMTSEYFIKCFITLVKLENNRIYYIGKSIPKEIFPGEQLEVIFRSKLSKKDNFTYKMLSLVVNKSDGRISGFQVPFDSTMSDGFCKLIKSKKQWIYENKDQIKMFYDSQIANINKANIVKLIRVVRFFGAYIFQSEKNREEALTLLASSGKQFDPEMRVSIVKAIGSFKLNSAPILLYFALCDDSPKVRASASKHLHLHESVINSKVTAQLLRDSSVEVCIASFKVIRMCIENNPLLFVPEFHDFMFFVFKKFATLSDFVEIADYSEIIPDSSYMCLEKIPVYANSFLKTIIMFLSRGKYKYDMFDGYICKDNIFPPHERDTEKTLKMVIYGSIVKPYINKRDCNLLRALHIFIQHRSLGNDLESVVDILKKFIVENTDADCLIETVQCIMATINVSKLTFSDTYKDILPNLFSILSKTNSKKLATIILNLFGYTATSTLDIPSSLYDSSFEMSDIYQPDFVIRSIIDNCLDNPPLSVFDVITTNYRLKPNIIIPYTNIILPSFIKAINEVQDDKKENFFNNLKHIVMALKEGVADHVDMLVELCKQHMTVVSCVHLITILSQNLKVGFTKHVEELYTIAITVILTNISKSLLESLLQFLVFAIVYQNQSIDRFLDVCSELLSYIEEKYLILRELIRVVHNSQEIFMYGIRIARILIVLYKHLEADKVHMLLYSLIIYCGLPEDIACQIIQNTKMEPNVLEQVKKNIACFSSNRFDIANQSKLMKKKCQFRYEKEKINESNQITNIKFRSDKEIYTFSSWYNDLIKLIIKTSPDEIIRECKHLVFEVNTFRSAIVPFAFYKTWQHISPDEKDVFLSQLSRVFNCKGTIEPSFYKIIDTLEMLDVDHKISNMELYRNTESTGRRIYYLTREFIINKKGCIDEILNFLHTKGRFTTMKGILDSVDFLDPVKDSCWKIRAGDWESALNSYYDSHELTDNIMCLGNLEMWDEIKYMYPAFSEMKMADKSKSSLWFALAFCYSNDIQKVENLIQYLPKNAENEMYLRVAFLKLLHYTKKGDYDKVKELIDDAFKYIAGDRQIFSGENEYLAKQYLVFSQYLIQFSEIANTPKDNKKQDLISLWVRRLDSFSGTERNWREFGSISSLIRTESTEFIMKMAISLRKNRRLNLLNTIHNTLIKNALTPEVLFEIHKAEWARGNSLSVKETEFFSNLYSTDKKDFKSFFDRYSDSIKTHLIDIFKISKPGEEISNENLSNFWYNFREKHEISSELKAKIYVKLLQWYDSSPSTNVHYDTESLKEAMILINNKKMAKAAFASTIAHLIKEGHTDDGVLKELIDILALNIDSLSLLILFNTLTHNASDETINNICLDKFGLDQLFFIAREVIESLHSDRESVRKLCRDIILRISKERFQGIVMQLYSDEFSRDLLTQICSDPYCKEIMREVELISEGLVQTMPDPEDEIIARILYIMRICSSGHDFKQLNGHIDDLQTIINTVDSFTLDHNVIFNLIKDIKTNESVRSGILDKLCKLKAHFQEAKSHAKFKYLPNISERLSNKRNMKMFVPGTETQISYIQPRIKSIPSNGHPRIVIFNGKDGHRYNFYITNYSVGSDQRVMQIFSIINNYILKTTSQTPTKISTYNVFPLSKEYGIVECLNNLESFKNIFEGFKSEREKESEVINTIFDEQVVNTMCSFQMLELHTEITAKTNGTELVEYIWRMSPSAPKWLEVSDYYTQSYALMSAITYILGISDRVPQNILIKKETGAILHLNFESALNSQPKNELFTETVPVRLTRSIINSFDGANPNGVFKKSFIDILTTLKEKKNIIESVITIEFNKVSDKQLTLLKQKLKYSDTSEQVTNLIKSASNPNNYGTSPYPWRSFW